MNKSWCICCVSSPSTLNRLDVRIFFYLGVWNFLTMTGMRPMVNVWSDVALAVRCIRPALITCWGQNMQMTVFPRSRPDMLLAYGLLHLQGSTWPYLAAADLAVAGKSLAPLGFWKLSALTDWCKWQSLKCILKISVALRKEECQYLVTELICGSVLS